MINTIDKTRLGYKLDKMADYSEEDTLLLAFVWQRRKNKRKNQRRFWIHDINKRRMALGEYPRLVHELRLDAVRFKQYFRMTPTVFDELLCLVGPHIAKENTPYRLCIEPGQRLAITLRLANKVCFLFTQFNKISLLDTKSGCPPFMSQRIRGKRLGAEV